MLLSELEDNVIDIVRHRKYKTHLDSGGALPVTAATDIDRMVKMLTALGGFLPPTSEALKPPVRWGTAGVS